MSQNRQQEKWNPGMGSDSAPQPKYDPDFGPGMEYESGERNNKADEAEKIREKWKESEKKTPNPSRQKDQEGLGL
jgi:hypothetical protein